MKQKIVMKVQMNCLKCRTNAMKIAASFNGVESVAIEGNDQLIVIGDGVNLICLVKCLRKKMCQADVVIGEEVTRMPPPGTTETEVVKEKVKEPTQCKCHVHTQFIIFEQAYESFCPIM